MDISYVARRHRVVALTASVALCLAAACLTSACSEDSIANDWQFDDDLEWQVRDLHGPLEVPAGDYRGRIDDTLYFEKNSQWSLNPHNAVTAYSTTTGWQPASDQIFDALDGDTSNYQEIIEAGGFSFILDRKAEVLHRSADGGQSWQQLSGPQPVHWGPMRTDGEHLFIPEQSSDVGGFRPARLWGSEDFGQTWEVILDNIESYYLRVADGVVTALVVVPREGDTLMRSTDGGDSWQQIGTVYELDDPYDGLGSEWWTSFDGTLVTPPDGSDLGGMIGVIDEDGLAEFHRIDGLESTDWVRTLVSCGGELFATASRVTEEGSSNIRRLGKIDASLSRWTEIDLPAETYVRNLITEDSLYCIGDQSLLLMTSAGVLRSDDQGATWRQVGSPFSSPDFAFEWDGQVHSGEQFEPMWTLGDDGVWTPTGIVPDLDPVHTLPSQGGITDVEKAGGSLYVTVDTDSECALYRIDEPGAEPKQLWSAEFDNSFLKDTDVEVDGDRIVVASSNAPYKILVSRDGGESFESVELPAAESANRDVESMRFHDGYLWTRTNDDVLWKIDLDEMSSESTGDGFPADMPVVQTPEVIRSGGGELLAFWDEEIYRRVDRRWAPLLTDELRADLGMPVDDSWDTDAPDIRDATVLGHTVLIATDDHVVFYNLDDGSYRLFEPDVDLAIKRLFNLDSGIYLGFDNGGLRRLEQGL